MTTMKWIKQIAIAIAGLALCTTALLAQAKSDPGVPGVYAIRNAKIVTVTGATIERGTIVIRNGKIEAVGANIAIPK
ncbi:MAG: amidohydrolase, partial [Acidobacteriota bacterium]|nr:amidohydrolase [Acidobacteriota bacterium]